MICFGVHFYITGKAFSGIFERGDRENKSLFFNNIRVLFRRPVTLVGAIELCYLDKLQYYYYLFILHLATLSYGRLMNLVSGLFPETITVLAL
jgi:hypothetical protein